MLEKFPGFLGYGGIIAIHADWPIYPRGIGWKIGLRTLGNFPRGTELYEIDDIDRCKLLINQNPQNLSVPSQTKYLHAAIWHEDLIELNNKGFVSGISAVSEYEFDLYRFEKLKKAYGDALKEDEMGNIIVYFKDNEGKLRELISHKPVSNDDDEEYASKDWVLINETISLTQNGFEELIRLSAEIDLVPDLYNLASPLIKIGRFDTAVRDACLFIETKIKEFHHEPQLYGEKLIDFHIKEIVKNNNNFDSAAIKCYRGELRTIFKFIRNDFAHNFKVLTEEQCKGILSRVNDIFIEFGEVASAYFKKNNI
jgi:hypothetical protein